jgi:5'-deoxy-5'-methylthioadenosine phosphorylase
MDKGPLGIIAGTGFYELEHLLNPQPIEIATHFGTTTAIKGTWHGRDTVFLPRHSTNHSIPPHMINYQANAYAMKTLGVSEILAISVVGGIGLNVGDLVVPQDFLDYTKHRKTTLYDGNTPEGIVHTDMSEPYSEFLRQTWIQAGTNLNIPLVDGGIYGCFDGPRFETKAEIQVAKNQGVTVVGMTGVPEVIFSVELGIPYSSLCIVANPAAGLSEQNVNHEQVVEELKNKTQTVVTLLNETVRLLA